MKIKFVEIRDEGTCIAAMAIRMVADGAIEQRFLRREGYPKDGTSVILMKLADQKATNDPYEWPSIGAGWRTMPSAHFWIIKHFDEIQDGAVVDVRVILRETTEPAPAEIWS